jgi:hypothetical protein
MTGCVAPGLQAWSSVRQTLRCELNRKGFHPVMHHHGHRWPDQLLSITTRAAVEWGRDAGGDTSTEAPEHRLHCYTTKQIMAVT